MHMWVLQKKVTNGADNTRASQKFCNILAHASLWYIYLVTDAVQAMESTCCNW